MLTFEFDGVTYPIKTSWGAAREFAAVIGDPLEMAISSTTGKPVFTAETVVQAIYIGIKHGANGGECPKLEQVGEMCHETGIIHCHQLALAFLVSMVSGSPEAVEQAETEKK